MPDLPARFAGIIIAFAPLFVHRSWRHAQLLLIGAILAPGRRTVTSLLRIVGRSHKRDFVNYHRVCAHHGHPTTDSMNIRPAIPRLSDHPLQPHPTRLI